MCTHIFTRSNIAVKILGMMIGLNFELELVLHLLRAGTEKDGENLEHGMQ